MKPQVEYLSASISKDAISNGISNGLQSITIIINHEGTDQWEWITVHRVLQMEFDVKGHLIWFETAHRRYERTARKSTDEAT